MHSRVKYSLVLFVLLTLILNVQYAEASIVGNTTTASATAYGYQGKVIDAQNLYWIFYSDGTNLVYATSSNATSWSSPTIIRACTDGYDFDVRYNGSYLAYVCCLPGSVKYRMGELQVNATITWSASEQTAFDEIMQKKPSICFDSSGYPYILLVPAGITHTPYVIKSSDNDGTWTMESGYPFDIANNSYYFGTIVPLTNNKVYVIASGCGLYETNAPPLGRLYNGSGWESAEEIGSSPCHLRGGSAVSVDDEVDFVYITKNPTTSTADTLSYVKRTATGSTSTTVLASNIYEKSNPTISKEGPTLIVSWVDPSNILHLKIHLSSWSPDMTYFSIDNLKALSTNSMYEKTSGKFGFVYVNGTTSPYSVGFQPFNYSAAISDYTIYNTGQLCPVLDVTYNFQQRELKFTTSGNVTISGVLDNPETVTVNDVHVAWQWIGDNVTLTNVNGKVVVKWKIPAREQGTSGSSTSSEETNATAEQVNVGFGTLGTLGLYILVFSIGIITVGGIISSLSKKKLIRKSHGSHARASRSPRGYSGRSRR